MVDESIRKICELPLEFHKGNKSAYQLVVESEFKPDNKEKQVLEIQEYLNSHSDLMNNWQIWSEDKRTKEGYYLNLTNKKSIVGYYSPYTNQNKKKFFTAYEACAEFIFLEISNILKS